MTPIHLAGYSHVVTIGDLRASGERRHRPASVRCISRPVRPQAPYRSRSLGSPRAASTAVAAARSRAESGRTTPGSDMGFSSMINWEEFGRPQLARTALNLSQPG